MVEMAETTGLMGYRAQPPVVVVVGKVMGEFPELAPEVKLELPGHVWGLIFPTSVFWLHHQFVQVMHQRFP
jgi:hypothetical protein